MDKTLHHEQIPWRNAHLPSIFFPGSSMVFVWNAVHLPFEESHLHSHPKDKTCWHLKTGGETEGFSDLKGQGLILLSPIICQASSSPSLSLASLAVVCVT